MLFTSTVKPMLLQQIDRELTGKAVVMVSKSRWVPAVCFGCFSATGQRRGFW